MIEKSNTALIQNMYGAFARGDVKAILETLAPNVEWIMDGPKVIPYAGKWTGPAQVLKFFEALGGTQEAVKMTTDDYIAQGDKVVTVGRYAATVKATGWKFDSVAVHVFTIKNGKVVKFLDVTDTAQVAEAYAGKSRTQAA
jgi:ketosteroid isomerase-like protein